MSIFRGMTKHIKPKLLKAKLLKPKFLKADKSRLNQVGALPFRVVDGRVEVLLVTSRETRRWLIPKGWPMKGKKPHKAAAQEAQSVLLDAGQAVAKVQAGYVEGLLAEAEAALKAKEPKKPEAVLAEAKAAAEKAVAVAKEGVDLSVAAQRKVAELLAGRAQANLAELRALAA